MEYGIYGPSKKRKTKRMIDHMGVESGIRQFIYPKLINGEWESDLCLCQCINLTVEDIKVRHTPSLGEGEKRRKFHIKQTHTHTTQQSMVARDVAAMCVFFGGYGKRKFVAAICFVIICSLLSGLLSST